MTRPVFRLESQGPKSRHVRLRWFFDLDEANRAVRHAVDGGDAWRVLRLVELRDGRQVRVVWELAQ